MPADGSRGLHVKVSESVAARQKTTLRSGKGLLIMKTDL
jgi:hypothetical protein